MAAARATVLCDSIVNDASATIVVTLDRYYQKEKIFPDALMKMASLASPA